MATIRKVFQSEPDAINYKDKNNWYAGGDLVNATMAGGDLWNPTANALITNNREKTDKNAMLLAGNILPYLGYGFGTLLNTIDSFSQFQTFLESNNKTTLVLRIDITVTTDNGQIIYSSSGSENEYGGDDSYGNNFQDDSKNIGTLKDLAGAWENRVDILGLISANPLTIAKTIYNVVTGESVTVKNRLSGALVGTVYSTFQSLAMQGIAKLAGITALTPAVMVGFGILGAIFGELVEMALGLDNHFGFGGELTGFDSFSGYHGLGRIEGVNTSMHTQYSAPKTVSTGLTDLFSGITDFLGITYDGGISIDWGGQDPDSFTNRNVDNYVSRSEIDNNSGGSGNDDGSGYGGYGDYGSGNDGTSSSAGGDYGGYGESGGNADGNNN